MHQDLKFRYFSLYEIILGKTFDKLLVESNAAIFALGTPFYWFLVLSNPDRPNFLDILGLSFFTLCSIIFYSKPHFMPQGYKYNKNYKTVREITQDYPNIKFLKKNNIIISKIFITLLWPALFLLKYIFS